MRPAGAILWRLDANGNLTGYDTSGTVLGKFIGTLFSSKLNKIILSSNTPINSTASTLNVSSGSGGTITPQVSGSVLVTANLDQISNNTASDGCIVSIYRKQASTVPSGGTSVGADAQTVVNSFVNNANTAGLKLPVQVVVLDTGLTAGTVYAYYIAVAVLTGGTMTWATPGVYMTGLEI